MRRDQARVAIVTTVEILPLAVLFPKKEGEHKSGFQEKSTRVQSMILVVPFIPTTSSTTSLAGATNKSKKTIEKKNDMESRRTHPVL